MTFFFVLFKNIVLSILEIMYFNNLKVFFEIMTKWSYDGSVM